MRKSLASALCVVLLAVVTAAAAGAQQTLRFTEGPWTGHMMIRGTATATIEGAPVTFTIDLDGFFSISVVGSTEDGDNMIGNEQSFESFDGGSWELAGTARFTGVVPGEGKGEVNWDLNASGSVDGTVDEPTLVGTTSTSNMVVTSGAGGTLSLPDQTDAARFELEIESASCYELYGTIDLQVAEQNLEAQGAAAAYRGTWAAYLDQGALNQAIADWTSEMRQIGEVPGAQIDPPANLPEVARLLGNVILAHNNWVDRIDAGPVGQPFFVDTAELINDSALFLVRLRNLSPCESDVLDPALIESFTTIAQRSLLLKGAVLAQNRELNAEKLVVLTNIALTSGALGTGAPEPDGSLFQEAVRAQVERILNANVSLGAEDGTGQDGLDVGNPDVVKVLALAGQMNWEVEFLGKKRSAAELWAEYVALSTPADPVGEEIEVNGADGADGDAGEGGDG